MQKIDKLSNEILKALKMADEPLETREIELLFKKETRIRILYRLNNLRGEGLISGKTVGSGKGCWVWWIKKEVNLK